MENIKYGKRENMNLDVDGVIKQIIMDPVTGGLILLAYSTQFLKKDKMVLFSLNSLIHCRLGIPLCLVQQFQKC